MTSDLSELQTKATDKQIGLEKTEARIRELQVKRMKSVTTSALNTSRMLNMEMGFVNELFTDWHMQLGLSSLSLADMGRHMQSIAKSTGLTGDRLQKSIKNADELVREMHKMGNYSDAAAENIMEFSAAFTKFGVDEAMMPIMKALTSRKAWTEAEDQIKRLFGEIGLHMTKIDPLLHFKAMSGEILHSKKDMNAFFDGWEKNAERFFKYWEDAGIWQEIGLTAEDVDLSNLTAAMEKLRLKAREYEEAGDIKRAADIYNARQMMSLHFKENMALEMGEAEKMNKAIADARLTMFERMEKIDGDLKRLAKQGLEDGKVYAEKEASFLPGLP